MDQSRKSHNFGLYQLPSHLTRYVHQEMKKQNYPKYSLERNVINFGTLVDWYSNPDFDGELGPTWRAQVHNCN